jgi:peroxiredoxin
VRISALLFVLISVTILTAGRAAALRLGPTPTDEVRIVASLEEAAGSSLGPVVLVFFSLDCPVCWEELFEVRYIVEKNSIPIAFVGISADAREDLEPFLAKHAFFYPVVSDGGRVLFRQFRVKLEPLVMVLDGGTVIHRDNTAEAFNLRREKLQRCLLEISAKRPS